MKLKLLLFLIAFLFIYPFSNGLSYGPIYRQFSDLSKLQRNPLDDLLKQWKARNDIINLGKDRIGLNELSNLNDVMIDHDIKNSPEIAILLLKEIDERKSELTKEEKLSMLLAVLKIAPDLPAIHFQTAKNYFSLDPLNFKKWGSEFFEGFSLFIEDMDNVSNLYVNTAFWISIALSAFALVFYFILFIKYVHLLVHLILHIFSQMISKFAVYFVIFALPVTAILLFGPLSIILIFAVYFWLFAKPSERFILGGFLLILAVLPHLTPFLSFPIKFQGSIEREMLKINLSPDYLSNYNRFSDYAVKNQDDWEAKFVLALLSKRLGNFEKSKNLLEEITSKKPNWDKAFINLGNLKLIEGDFEGAISDYNKAASFNDRNFLAKYNSGKALYLETKIEEATNELKNASAMDPANFERYEELSSPKNPLRFVFDDWISSEDLKDRIAVYKKPDYPLGASLWDSAGLLNATPAYSSLILVITLILLIMMLKLSKAIDPPKACDICGAAYCTKCSKISDRKRLCAQCHYIFVLKESIDQNFRLKKEILENRQKAMNKFFRNYLSFLLPGFGHIYSGLAIKGGMLLFTFLLSLSIVVFRKGIVEDPYSIYLNGPLLIPVVLITAMALLAIYSILNLRKLR